MGEEDAGDGEREALYVLLDDLKYDLKLELGGSTEFEEDMKERSRTSVAVVTARADALMPLRRYLNELEKSVHLKLRDLQRARR